MKRRLRCAEVMLTLGILWITPISAFSQAESSSERVRQQFEQESQRAKTKLNTDFGTVLDRLSKSRESTDRKVAILDVIKEEKESFEKFGQVPWSTPMLPYADAYLAALR